MEGGEGEGFDITPIIEGAIFGAVGALAAELGIWVAGGDISAEDAFTDLLLGGIGGVIGGLIRALGGSDLLVTAVSPFLAAVIGETFFPENTESITA